MSVLGLVGTVIEHQQTLFAYMIILSLVCIVQFSISIAALTVNSETVARQGWCALDDSDRSSIQTRMACFGFEDANPVHFNVSSGSSYCLRPGGCPSSCTSPFCPPSSSPSACPLCYDSLKDQIDHVVKEAGGVGLAFSLLEVRIMGF